MSQRFAFDETEFTATGNGCVKEIEQALGLIAEEHLIPTQILCAPEAFVKIQNAVILSTCGSNSYIFFSSESFAAGSVITGYRDRHSSASIPIRIDSEAACGFVVEAISPEEKQEEQEAESDFASPFTTRKITV